MIKELRPIYATQKSFYNKAHVEATEDAVTLYSYNTKILKYNRHTEELTPLYDGWTQTTGRHINEFVKQYTPLNVLNKKGYMELLDAQKGR